MLTFRSILVLLALTLPAAAVTGAAPRVVDGDTLVLDGQKVRLFGIDAPEQGQTCDRRATPWDCGAWSARVLADLVSAGPVTCAAQDTDSYGRMVAICTIGHLDLGQAMVQQGAAVAYTRYSDRYLRDETRAKQASLGLWSGKMVTPETYRHPKAVADAPPQGCQIKGNIGTSGRIYHRPGQRDYAATRISTAKGEAWFCTAAEAEAAGFRAARR